MIASSNVIDEISTEAHMDHRTNKEEDEHDRPVVETIRPVVREPIGTEEHRTIAFNQVIQWVDLKNICETAGRNPKNRRQVHEHSHERLQ